MLVHRIVSMPQPHPHSNLLVKNSNSLSDYEQKNEEKRLERTFIKNQRVESIFFLI